MEELLWRPGPGWANLLARGDNLDVLKNFVEMKGSGALSNGDGTPGARLVYIDPPFATRTVFRTRHNRKAYRDNLTGPEYVEFLRKRLVLLRELLSEDGSIFVHIDWKKAHYVKVLLDELFGPENFLNEIIWSYGGRGAKAVARQFSRNHDTILWYRKGKTHTFNQIYREKRVPKGEGGFRQDSEGRWFKTSPRGDYTDKSVRELEREGRIHRTRNGKVRVKYFLREEGDHLVEDKLVGDVWDDVPDAMHISRAEKTGYPTQKPEALVSRIVRAASNPGDLVLDGFSGSGTTPVVAEKLGRRWAAVDSGEAAVHTTLKRLFSMDDDASPFRVLGPGAGAAGGAGVEVSFDPSAGEWVVEGGELDLVAACLDHVRGGPVTVDRVLRPKNGAVRLPGGPGLAVMAFDVHGRSEVKLLGAGPGAPA